MNCNHDVLRRTVNFWLALLLALGPGGPVAAQQKAPAAAAKPAAVSPVIKDPGWPRVYTNGTATLAVHQPQVDDWKDFKLLEARMAMELLPAKGAKKLLAAVHWEAQTDTNIDNRQVAIGDVKITRFSVPGLDEAKTKEMQALAVSLLPKKRDTIALDRILPYLDKSRVTARQVKISTEAPPIMVSTRPAILVMIDGQPILGPIGESKLTFVVNTNWDLFKVGKDGDFYLLNGLHWLTAEALEGPWKSASKLPKELNSLPAGENWNDTRKALPLSKENKSKPAPWVYVSLKPAELVLLEGEARFAPIQGTALSEVTNTKSLLFYHNPSKTYYFLTSGRWFRSQQLRGTWDFASDSLPEDFRKIPASHPKSHVLASVPGTGEAADAVLLASVPQVAVINRKQAAGEAKAVYVGAPEFKPIEGTTLQYAANTPADVIKVQDKFYLCQEGVWFVGSTANGPWEVADTIPQEIYTIPPESSKHHTTYVYVTNSGSETVTTAQTAGYAGMAIGVGIGVAVWGTGYYYPPYYYWGPMYPYPVYWGYPYYSYGAAAWYNPATGFYGRGAVAYGPYGGYGRAAAYNPATGTYARRAAAYGPYQAGMAASFYNPRTGAWGGGYRYANPYQGWGQGVVAKGGKWAKGGYYYDDRGAIGGIRTSEGGRLVAAGDGENRAMIGRTSDGDLYVGKNGEIYKRAEWEWS
ncbi:MAG: hypothetical protein HXY18_02600, partial [Bryobacteraceae bacterium]|nr:hypothetical protein [Bryobacteraceae bacterium]